MNGVPGGVYDFGDRIYDARLGRWTKLDPQRAAYPGVSPYSFALNTPIRAKDPDGNVVIYVNGEVGVFHGPFGNGSHPNRGSISYWGANFVNQVNRAFGEKFTNSRFVDGDLSMSQSERYERGAALAKNDFADIMKNLKRDENGKIIETIKVVSHSKGSATANGYIDGLKEMIEANKDQFADPTNAIETHLMLAPHQSWAMNVKKSKTATVAVTHGGDLLSDDDVSGDATTIETGSWFSWAGLTQDSHRVKTFLNEAVKLAKKLTENKGKGKSKYEGTDGLLDNQQDYNAPTNK